MKLSIPLSVEDAILWRRDVRRFKPLSILDPKEVATSLGVPPSWVLVGYLLLGWPEEEHLDPELERFGWQSKSDSRTRISRV